MTTTTTAPAPRELDELHDGATPPGAPSDAAPPSTTMPDRPLLDAPEERTSTATLRATDLYAVLGAVLASLCLSVLLFTVVLPWNGPLGFVVCAYLGFLAIYALLVSLDESGPAVRDRIAAVVIHSLAFVMLMGLTFIVVYTIARGASAMRHLNFFTQDMTGAGPIDPLTQGGIVHGVVGTLIMITIALLITVPLGIVCALFLSELPGRFSRLVRTVAEAMTALPSIVAGLFIYATFILLLGFEKSGLAASLAISVMMLPIIIRASDVVLRLVPGNLKEASLAMGAGQWRTVWHVTLPTARSGLATAVILGTARGIGETAPVLLTAGFAASLNTNPTQGPMVSLPLLVFDFVKSPEPHHVARGFGAASTLLLLVLLLFVIARVIGGRGPGHLTKRQRRRRAAQSARDVERFDAAAAHAPTALAAAPGAAADPSAPPRHDPADE
jgi:phosphate transport system permease protein